MIESVCCGLLFELNSIPYPPFTPIRYRPFPSGPVASGERTKFIVNGATAGNPVVASEINLPAGVVLLSTRFTFVAAALGQRDHNATAATVRSKQNNKADRM